MEVEKCAKKPATPAKSTEQAARRRCSAAAIQDLADGDLINVSGHKQELELHFNSFSVISNRNHHR